jgi:hypothetical protein
LPIFGSIGLLFHDIAFTFLRMACILHHAFGILFSQSI